MAEGGEGAPSAEGEGEGEGEGNQQTPPEPKVEEKDGKILIDGEEFDPERAIKTIRNQRDLEKQLKEKIRDLEAKLDGAKTAEQQAQEAQQQIQALEARLAEREVRSDFETKAQERFSDAKLAYLAAKQEGLLGKYDPESGEVSDHDLDKLAEKFPALVKGQGPGADGDAGRGRGQGGNARTVNDQFNRIVRGG